MNKNFHILSFLIFSLFISPSSASLAFTDVDSSSIFNESITYAQEKGIVNGYKDGSFKPQKEINRAEFTKIIIEANFQTNEIYGEKCFPDVRSQWFAKYICTAKRKGIVKGYYNGNFGPDDKISFVESAKIITLANGENIQENNSSNWFTPYIEKLSEKKAIPATIKKLDKKIQRGEMAEIIWRIAENKTDKANSIFQNNQLEGDNPIICTKEYRPVCGRRDSGIRCITTPCPSSEEKTFGNQCMLESSDFTFLHQGECKSETPTITPTPPNICPTASPLPANSCFYGTEEVEYKGCIRTQCRKYPAEISNSCTTWFDGCNTCTKGENEDILCTKMSCEAYQTPYCTSFASPTPNICPVYDIPQNFCFNGTLEYKKDENGCDMPICKENIEKTFREKVEEIIVKEGRKICSKETTSQNDFLFSGFPVYQCGNIIGIFPPAGIADAPNKYYTPDGEIFFCGGFQMQGGSQDARCNTIGECKKTELNVCPLNAATPTPNTTPVQETCSMKYDPICAQPPMTKCPEGVACTQVMPSPKTYQNICFMKNVGATFLHPGQCNNQ